MFTPSKPIGADFMDMTILSTPQPQAASTVQRKSTLESRIFDKNEPVCKQTAVQQHDVTRKSDESLGILSNLSSSEVSGVGDIEKQDENKLDTERELARKLLQRCSDIKPTSITYDTNKENNANIQNLIATDSGQSNSQNKNTSHIPVTKSSSVIFEPNEISARSSGLSNTTRKLSTTSSNKSLNAMSFDSTTAELMAQLAQNEEFRPASEMASQMLADEVSWQQNYPYALPTTTPTEKEYLNLSCFSGIIGELDLSVESCAEKLTVDEFFKRKCGDFGELSDDAARRPSLGISIDSPRKKQLVPLIDSTVVTEDTSVESYVVKDKSQSVPNITKDIEDQSIMSLTSIAQALQDIDNGTPRRLVDQLIMAKKKKKLMQLQDDIPVRDTYTLHRQSMPASTPSKNTSSFEKDGLSYLSGKLSLDSKINSEMIDVKEPIRRMISLDSSATSNANFEAAYQELKKEMSNAKRPSYSQDFKLLLEDSKFSLPNYAIGKETPRNSEVNEKNSTSLDKEESQKKETIKQENVSYKDISETSVQIQQNESYMNNVVIGKGTEELCNVIVGISRETDIELLNKSDRWVICSLNVNQIQGDKQNVQLTLPKDVVLIKPNSQQRAKITVTVVEMCKPIIAVLNITVSDMVTKLEWIMKHIICFKPEELNVDVLCPSEKKALDFGSVVEDTLTTLPITIKNKNSVDVTLKFFIAQNRSAVFSFEKSEESYQLTLKSQEIFTMNVSCTGILEKTTEAQERSLQHYGGTLRIQARNNSDNNILIREVPLIVQVGTCKIQVIDTELPLIVPNKQTKPLVVINLGTIPTTISAAFVQDVEFMKNSKYFSVQPEKLLAQPEETSCFLVTYKNQSPDAPKMYAKIKLTSANSVHYYSVIGESNTYTEAENENFSRCETPQCSSSVSSPSSPHSVTSNKSGNSGRNSPLSSVSGATVAGDKIPIRTTHAALVWNSVKTGKSEVKEFTIRNTSNNKIKIQVTISDNEKNFRFLRDRQAAGTSVVLILQGSESRTISVMFSPHHSGAAAGKVIFKHYEPRRNDAESRPSKVLFLYGYGGYSKVEISEAYKDTTGKMWLSLGSLNSGGSLNAKIKLQNNGDLCSYVKIKLTPKAVYPTMIASWQVDPTELLLNPKEVQWVSLEFHPRKEDLAVLQRSDVSHVGTLLITHGDEPTRLRIRRLYNKMKEIGEISGSENETFRNIVHPICKAFPGEQLTSDISVIRDSLQNLGDLCRGIRQHEIMLTMEVCADETLSILQDSADESQMFYSLCSDHSHIYEGHGESFLPSETLTENSQPKLNADNFMVSPSVIILSPPTRTEAIVTIKSSCTVAQPFETNITHSEYLSVVPAEGMIPTRRDFQLKVQCKRKIERNLTAALEIYTENNKVDVQIRVNVKRL
ncbi:uncharacterized protein LOC108626103 isoform X2 [Ceratina calcarata]|uniref:Uncharacterized protein LOC108626103 isoform X2 n=1 Tax=Ceratina calcarata TaxID=156304 RepID=A0AAJ7S477_9HYME|nr:uncharacterized protein LOC108626103 isoform X2 [Ceratina calcarata]